MAPGIHECHYRRWFGKRLALIRQRELCIMTSHNRSERERSPLCQRSSVPRGVSRLHPADRSVGAAVVIPGVALAAVRTRARATSSTTRLRPAHRRRIPTTPRLSRAVGARRDDIRLGRETAAHVNPPERLRQTLEFATAIPPTSPACSGRPTPHVLAWPLPAARPATSL